MPRNFPRVNAIREKAVLRHPLGERDVRVEYFHPAPQPCLPRSLLLLFVGDVLPEPACRLLPRPLHERLLVHGRVVDEAMSTLHMKQNIHHVKQRLYHVKQKYIT